MASPSTLLAASVLSFLCVGCVNTYLALALDRPAPITSLVATWAFQAIAGELADPVKLNDPSRYNPHAWSAEVLGGLRGAAETASWAMVVLAAAVMVRRAVRD